MAKKPPVKLASFTLHFKDRHTGKPIGGDRTFTKENAAGPMGVAGYRHNLFTMTAIRADNGKTIKPKHLLTFVDGDIYAVYN